MKIEMRKHSREAAKREWQKSANEVANTKSVVVVGSGAIAIQQIYNLLLNTEYNIFVLDESSHSELLKISIRAKLEDATNSLEDDINARIIPDLDESVCSLEFMNRMSYIDDLDQIPNGLKFDFAYICKHRADRSLQNTLALTRIIDEMTTYVNGPNNIVICSTVSHTLLKYIAPNTTLTYAPMFLDRNVRYAINAQALQPYAVHNEKNPNLTPTELGLFVEPFKTGIEELALYKHYTHYMTMVKAGLVQDLLRMCDENGGNRKTLNHLHRTMTKYNNGLLKLPETHRLIGGDDDTDASSALSSEYAVPPILINAILIGAKNSAMHTIKAAIIQLTKRTVDLRKVKIYLFGYSWLPNTFEVNDSPVDLYLDILSGIDIDMFQKNPKFDKEQIILVDPHCHGIRDDYQWVDYREVVKDGNSIFIKLVNHDEFKNIEFDIDGVGDYSDY